MSHKEQIAILRTAADIIEDLAEKNHYIPNSDLIRVLAKNLGVKIEISEPKPSTLDPYLRDDPFLNGISPQIGKIERPLDTNTTPNQEPITLKTQNATIHKEKPLKALQPEDAIKIVSIRSAIGNYRLTIDGPIETAIRKAKRKETLTAVYAEGPSRGRHIEVRADRLKAVVREGGSA